MSFVFGLSLGNAGWLLSDTQLNFELKTGQRNSDELEPLSIYLNQVGEVRWGRQLRKLAAMPNGYASGAGDAVLCRLVLDALQELKDPVEADKIGLVIASKADSIRKPLCEQLPGAATSFDRTTFVTLLAGSDRPELCSISTNGNISNLGQEYVAAWPPDLGANEVHLLMNNLAGLLVPSSPDEAFRNISVLSKLAAEVHARSMTVGGRVEVGMTIVDQGVMHMGYISGVAIEFAAMSPRELSQAMLERRVVPC